MKTYGIYLAYPPELDLQAEGLGRYLIEFLQEAKNRPDAKFVIACPSWTRKSLKDLFEDVGISPAAFEIIGPKDQPILLRLHQSYQAYKRRVRRQSRILQFLRFLKRQYAQMVARAERLLVTTRSSLLLASLALFVLPFVVIGLAAMAILMSVSCRVFDASRPNQVATIVRTIFRSHCQVDAQAAGKFHCCPALSFHGGR